MKRIGLLSDTHGYLDPRVMEYFARCDEIWHAGDFGDGVAERLAAFKPLKGVYGNIDGPELRRDYPLDQRFDCEGVTVWMTHVGGYPGRYDRRVKKLLEAGQPQLFVCGHSHILRIMRDTKRGGMLVINPGAVGKAGFQRVKTIVRFAVDAGKVGQVEVIELGTQAKTV
ncbi:MAG: metallophosphoesterase family protein [Candidatus Eremiobacteraeota bacterium]|nr:metallophosphoesterase family protein [Candidatus Eremiobacteraeota bacterium]MBC5827957.1 metallophosphoesterase family protein [Candidatus Eremiobacteraeota bacterium]